MKSYGNMPIVLCNTLAQTIGIVASPLYTSLLAVPVPIVPISYLLNVVVIDKKVEMGMEAPVYAHREFGLWAWHIGTGGFMREKQIEQKLVKAVKQSGGIALKFVSPGYDGMPDRLVLLPGGKITFVEVKSEGQKPRPLQVRRHEMLRRLGFRVYVLDDARQIGGILDEIQST